MAEALGLASSIVALVQLSASVYSATSKFYREAKDAKSRVSALATQIRNLSGVLQSLSLLASAPLYDDAGAPTPDFRDTYIGACHTTLQKIKRKLEKAEKDFESGSHRKVVTRSLKWPFAAQETTDLVTELSQHQNVLQLALSADTVSQLFQCLATTKGLATSIEGIAQKLEKKESIEVRAELTKRRENIVQFFLKVNPQNNFQDCLSRRQPNTGRWLIERDETFQTWLNSPGSQIWLSGIPGAGKTILCSTVIEEILQKQSTSTAVAFFFCDYKSTQTHEPVNVLGAIAVQLAKQGDAAFELLESYYEELHPQNGIPRPPNTKGLIDVTRAMINEYDSVYLAIDGLDECGSKAVEVIQPLNELAKGDQVTMALFSRNEPDIAEELSDSLHIEIAAHTEDLELYVLAEMENRKRLCCLAVKNAELHEHIVRTLIQGANGMFRWVACQLDHLDGLPSDGRRRRALTELPPTLFATYDRILDRIMQEDAHSKELCRKALHWIGLGCERLNCRALCEAISIPDDQDAADPELFVDTDWVSRSCSSLIRLSRQSSNVPNFQLAHFTVKEYLRSIEPQSNRGAFRFSEGEAIRELLQTSLRFLTFPIFDQAPIIAVSEIGRMKKRNQKHPFYPAAAEYIFCSSTANGTIDAALGNEFASLINDETMMKYALKLFNPDKTAFFLSWVLQFMWFWDEDVQLDEELFSEIVGLLHAPEFSTLHVAATLALPSICKYLIETRRGDINKCCRLGTPLHALLAGIGIYCPSNLANFKFEWPVHERDAKSSVHDQCRECLEIFVQYCADTSVRCGGKTVFQMALEYQLPGWIEPLVTTSTAVDEACIDDFKAAITKISLNPPIVGAIYELGSVPDVPPMWARLASVIETNRMEERRHEGDIPINLQRLSDEDFEDALRISLEQNLTDNVELLVQDPRFLPDIYLPVGDHTEPILHFAIRAGNPRLLQVLFKADCDPKIVDEGTGWTALHQCAWSNKDDAANAVLLLRSGLSDSIRDMDGETCWHTAADNGNIPVLKALIELGFDTAKSLRTASKGGRTPLASAIFHSKTESALLLLDHCLGDAQFFQSHENLLDKAVAIGSEELFLRLYEKMKQFEAEEALQCSNPVEKVNMACSPKFVSYLLTTWAAKNNSKSRALENYLLDSNSVRFEDSNECPQRADLDHIIRQLLPISDDVDDQDLLFQFWKSFCENVVINLTRSCGHEKDQCRGILINRIFQILIEAGVLDSFERNAHIPSYRVLFQSLIDRGKEVQCSWISSSVQMVIEANTLSGGLANDSASNKLLSLAVRDSNIDLVKRLLHHGVDVNAAHNDDLSPIEQACHSADLPTFELVIKHADRLHINRVGNRGKTLLHWVVSGNVQGYLTKIQQLLKLGADIDANVVDTNADTALTLASRSEREDIVALLVSEAADVLHRARDGWSLLHAAAVTGDLRYVQPLDRPRVPASYWRGTCEYPLVQIQTDIPHTTQRVTATHLAAASGRTNFLRFMTQHDLPLDVNAVTGFPAVTPLNVASVGGHLDVVEFLIARKANVNTRNAFGLLPIDLAAKIGHLAIFKALLKSGSETPSSNGSDSIALLMSKETEGAELHGDSDAMSAFFFEQAIVNNDLNRCKDMVKRGLSINGKLLTDSYTPLVRAVVQGQTLIVDWLVSSRVDVSNPVFGGLHPSMRCIVPLATHYIASPQTLSAIMSLALRQSVSWYGGVLSPLHVAILDNKVEALEVILKHIQENDHAYRMMIEAELICVPADAVHWRVRTALSILVGLSNREEALLSSSPWARRLPPGSPLHWAIRYSNVSAVKLLLKHKADVNQVDSLGMTPLQIAVLSMHPTELVQELLQAGAGVDEPSRGRIGAMNSAVRRGNLELVKTLAEADPETLKCVDQFSADFRLKTTGSAAVFQYLVCAGANPAAVAEPRHSAITFHLLGPADRLRPFLIHSGLFYESSEQSLAFSLSRLADEGSLASIRLVNMLRRTLANGVFTRILNWTSRDDASPLCWAASVNAAGMAEALIGSGAKLEMEGCRHGSPLLAACAWGNLDAARVLVRAGALLCYVNEEGTLRSAISAALRHQRVVNWLLVVRYTEQPKLDYQPSQTTPHESVWSGPRLFKLVLPAYMLRDFHESRWGHLGRLQRWRGGLRGFALAESRRDSGLDFYAGFDAEARIKAAEAAHHRFLMKLGEV